MPAYNEERSIAKMVLGCKKHVDKVVDVDDGSSDATAEIASALGAYVIRHEKNSGYGAALRTCFETARALDADKMVIIGPDGQHNDAEIPELLDGLQEGNDAVLQDTEFLSGSGAYGRRAIETIQINGDDGSSRSEILDQIQHLKVGSVPSGRPRCRETHYRGKLIAVVVPAYNEE